MRILFALSSMSTGGKEVFTAALAEKLAKGGEDIGILIFKSYDERIGLSKDDKINIFLAHRKGKFNFLFLLNIYRTIKHFRPHIILSLSEFTYFFIESLQRAFGFRIPHIIAVHSFKSLSLEDVILSKIFVFFSKLYKAHYLFVSNNQYDWYRNYYGIPKERSFVTYNAVDINFFSPAKEKNDGIFTIVHIGNIRPEKDQWVLLEALNFLNKHIKDWKLIFIGEDRYDLLKEFRSYLQKKDMLDKVLFVKGADRASVKKSLSSSDVFILTSLIETLPVAALEAMAMGVPCILTDVGGCSEIVEDGHNGYLVSPRDYKEVADRLLHLYKHPDLLKQMGRNAREAIEEKFNLDKCTEKYLETFRTVQKNLR